MQGSVHSRQSDVQATLNIGDETKTSADAAFIRSWKSKAPQINMLFFPFVLGGKNQQMATHVH